MRAGSGSDCMARVDSRSSAGTGSASHLTYLLFTRLTKTEIQHVPYRGSSQATNDLLSGQIDMTFEQVVSAAPHILSGGVNAIAVTATTIPCATNLLVSPSITKRAKM